MSTFAQIDNPSAWGFSTYDCEWYNRKQTITIFDGPLFVEKPGHVNAWLNTDGTKRRIIHTEECMRLAFGLLPVHETCFFLLIQRDEQMRAVKTCFLADGRRFNSDLDACNAILADLGVPEDHHGSRTWQGVAYHGTPLGAYTKPVFA
jgi:hypothetical protein